MRMRIGLSKKDRKVLDRQRDMFWRETGAKTTTVKKPGDQPNATSHVRSVKLNPRVTIISQFKGPMKRVATTTGVLMIVFSVVDTKTKEELSCKAFGNLAKGILRNASIRAGAVVEMSGQFNLYRGRLEFVVSTHRVAAPINASSNPIVPAPLPKSEDIQCGHDGESEDQSISSAQNESRELEPASSSSEETRGVNGDKPNALPIGS
jgi:hypothetical protein